MIRPGRTHASTPSVYRSRIGVRRDDPSVRPSCVVTPRNPRWCMDARPAPLSRPQKGWDAKTYPLTLNRHESESPSLRLSRPWRGGLGADAFAPLPCRQEEVSHRRLSRPQKEWDAKTYPLSPNRHESESPSLRLSHPWRGGMEADAFAPLPCRQEEVSHRRLSRLQKAWDAKTYPLTLNRHGSERSTLRLSRPWRRWLGVGIFAPNPHLFLETTTPRATFHF